MEVGSGCNAPRTDTFQEGGTTLQVQIDPNLQKGLRTLRKKGGRACHVADHVESIIHEVIATGGQKCSRDLGRATRNGEARIKNALKFDLVNGYRLIAVRQEEVFAFLFVGTHDECDRWVRNNTGLNEPTLKRRSEVISIDAEDVDEAVEEECGSDVIEPDDYPFPELSDRELRIIFSGLCRGAADHD